MDWFYAMPVWLSMIGAIAISTTLASVALLFVLRYFPRRDGITHNDVAGPIVGTLGTILAVVLSFMVVTVWQEYDAAASTVQAEVNAICDLYHDASTLPQPMKGTIQGQLARYVDAVVNHEWPRMRRGETSRRAHIEASRVLNVIARVPLRGKEQEAYRSDMLVLAHAFSDARRQRLFDNQEAVPAILWWTLFFISIVTVGSVFLFRVASARVHVIMTGSLAAVIASILVLVAQFDLPFRGDIQIAPNAFSHATLAIHEDPPTSVYSPNALR